MSRETDIIELCEKVLNVSPNRYYNPNGVDETTCPFCLATDHSNNCTADIKDIKHTPDCAMHIAKDLLINHP